MEETMAMSVGEGLVQALLGYALTIVVAMLTAGLIWAIVASLGRLGKKEATKPVPTAVPISKEPAVAAFEAERGAHVAAVAAAAYAVIGEARIVHIGPAMHGPSWRTTGRSLHHASHTPRQTHPH